jgi:glyoxylase-like metal-dependent hydrolase (beta-lactamase superfamily II)
MADDIPFDRSFDDPPGQLREVSPLIRRMVAGNSGPFTFTGTCTYVVGRGDVAVLDPGPDDPGHVERLLAALAGERVSHIVVTHTHRDHSPAVPAVKAATGATVYAEGPHRASRPSRRSPTCSRARWACRSSPTRRSAASASPT